MHPLALQKLWKLSGGRLPHLDSNDYLALVETAGDLHDPHGLHYWGVVGQQVRYRGHQLLHCYNFGNTDIAYPWRATLANFGHEVPARITRGGTVKTREQGKSLLDRIVDPYLVFGFESDAAPSEHLQPGMLVTAGKPRQSSSYDIVVPEGVAPAESGGMLYYYLMKRLSFAAGKAERFVPPGKTSGMECFTIHLQQPIIMEAGWPVLMLEKDRWFWGVVCR